MLKRKPLMQIRLATPLPASPAPLTRNTHAAWAGGAQELADDGVPRSDIADLGHWTLDKLAKSYITTISKAAAVSCATAREPNTAGVHFLQSLIEFGRRIVAEDLACMLIREPWHPYVQSSKLCRDPDFQKWAKDVNRVDLETIATRGTPTENPLEEFSARVDAFHQVDQLTMMLHRQREDVAIEKLGMQKQLEEDAEIARLMQALKLADARPTAPTPPTTRPMTTAEKAAPVKIEKEQDDDLTYEVNVVHPWRTSKTVVAMRRIMEAVHDLRRSDDDADTAAVIKLLDHLGRAGLSTFSDALLVLRATPPIKVPTTADRNSVGIKGLDKPLARKLAVAWGVVTAGYMDTEWGKRLFGDLWEEHAKKAGLEAEATAGATGAGKRKRAG
ncbi:unnamed protein product [Closterium sp. NIES-64]|nr:unnamed protein product [Closterium sp. NIES-64]